MTPLADDLDDLARMALSDHDAPTRATMALKLLAISALVRRMERALDEIAADAQEDAEAAERRAAGVVVRPLFGRARTVADTWRGPGGVA